MTAHDLVCRLLGKMAGWRVAARGGVAFFIARLYASFGFRNVENHRRRIRWACTRKHRRASAILNELPGQCDEPCW